MKNNNNTTLYLIIALIAMTCASCASQEDVPTSGASMVGFVGAKSEDSMQSLSDAEMVAMTGGNTAEKMKQRLAYIERFVTVAQDEQRKYGIPASVTLAQAILETGAGTSWVANNLQNHFGIKCKAENYLEIGCKPNPLDKAAGDYAVYKSDWYSFRAHSLFLVSREPYRRIPAACGLDSRCWIKAIAASGYSENPSYDSLLMRVIEFYGLERYDAIPLLGTDAPIEEPSFSILDSLNRLGASFQAYAKSDQKLEEAQEVSQVTMATRHNVSPREATDAGKLEQGDWVWLLNNSHGKDTPGKRYRFDKRLPNGQHTIYEWQLNRAIVRRVITRCNELGLNYRVLVTEDTDVPLKERVARANALQKQLGNCLLLTFDHNAGGFDNEHSASIAETYGYDAVAAASGMEGFHHTNNKKMEHFLEVLGQNVEKRLPDWYSRGTKAKNFYTIRKTTMPAVILELGFFDNYKEACFIQSEAFQSKMTEAIVETMCYFSNVPYSNLRSKL